MNNNTYKDAHGHVLAAPPGRLLVKLDPLKKRSDGGIFLPDALPEADGSLQTRAARGAVVSSGAPDIAPVGARVAWPCYHDQPLGGEVEGEFLSSLKIEDVIVVEGGGGFLCVDGTWLRPGPGRLLVRLGEAEATTAGGIVIPEAVVARDRPHRGTVLAVGQGAEACGAGVGDGIQWEDGQDVGVQQGAVIMAVVKAEHLMAIYR